MKEYTEKEALELYDEKMVALVYHMNEDLTDEVFDSISSINDSYELHGESYKILTDEEADEMWDEYMDTYIDDCVLPHIPEDYQRYFDTDAYKRDCEYDGRGNSLSPYDGYEHVECVNGVDYYLYRE